MNKFLEKGDTVMLPTKVRRTFWEWLTRKPARTEDRLHVITHAYANDIHENMKEHSENETR